MEVSLKATGESNLSHEIVGSLYYMQQIIGLYVHGSVGQRLEAFLWQQMLGI